MLLGGGNESRVSGITDDTGIIRVSDDGQSESQFSQMQHVLDNQSDATGMMVRVDDNTSEVTGMMQQVLDNDTEIDNLRQPSIKQ